MATQRRKRRKPPRWHRSPPSGTPRRLVLRVAMVQIFLSCIAADAGAADQPKLKLLRESITDQVILKRQSYDYAPAIIRDGNIYRLYWCAGVAGDFILYAEASDPSGPWHASQSGQPNSYDVALRPTGSPDNFDGLHTCDPNVIKVAGRYYMYYGGAAKDGAITTIGVAASADGIHFARLNGGRPIVTPALTNPRYAASHLTYGAGQPAVLYRAPYFYLSFTDSTGAGANPGNGAGQFLLRAKEPTFQADVQEWTGTEWADRTAGQHTAAFSYLESFGLDWMYDAPTDQIIVASDRVAGKVTLFLLDPQTFTVRASGALPAQWREGPALIAQSDRTTAVRSNCESIEIGVVVAEGPKPDPWTWDLALSSGNFSISPCADTLK
jgi:hypothetical protein